MCLALLYIIYQPHFLKYTVYHHVYLLQTYLIRLFNPFMHELLYHKVHFLCFLLHVNKGNIIPITLFKYVLF